MNDSANKRPMPARALASVLSAGCSLFMFRVYGEVHGLPTRFAKEDGGVFLRVLSQVGPIRDQLDMGYRVLAAVSLAWCLGSWRTEARIPAIVATAFAALAMFCAVCVAI